MLQDRGHHAVLIKSNENLKKVTEELRIIKMPLWLRERELVSKDVWIPVVNMSVHVSKDVWIPVVNTSVHVSKDVWIPGVNTSVHVSKDVWIPGVNTSVHVSKDVWIPGVNTSVHVSKDVWIPVVNTSVHVSKDVWIPEVNTSFEYLWWIRQCTWKHPKLLAPVNTQTKPFLFLVVCRMEHKTSFLTPHFE